LLVVGEERVVREVENHAIHKVKDIGECEKGEREVHRGWVDRVTVVKISCLRRRERNS